MLTYSLQSIKFRGYYMAERRVVGTYILSRENKIHMFKPQCNFLSVRDCAIITWRGWGVGKPDGGIGENHN